MDRFVTLVCLFFALLLPSPLLAENFAKPLKAKLHLKPQGLIYLPYAGFRESSAVQTVFLMNMHLSAEEKQEIQAYSGESQESGFLTQKSILPRRIDLSMNGVPVMDQGEHGTCVTFAVTAAIDALIGRGDYVSQLCSLELGSYLQEKGYLPSGWDGTTPRLALNQLFGFGIVSKSEQQKLGCGGLNAYPLLNPNQNGSAMSLDEYRTMSERINDSLYWDTLLSFHERFEFNSRLAAQMDELLVEVKKTLAKHNAYTNTRLVIGSLMPLEYCSVGACAKHHAAEDTWVLTQSIQHDHNPELGGHEMVLLGYDDDAVAIDVEGQTHRGLFHLRNSWGPQAGDHGDYYMTYDYFKKYVTSIDKIVKLTVV